MNLVHFLYACEWLTFAAELETGKQALMRCSQSIEHFIQDHIINEEVYKESVKEIQVAIGGYNELLTLVIHAIRCELKSVRLCKILSEI